MGATHSSIGALVASATALSPTATHGALSTTTPTAIAHLNHESYHGIVKHSLAAGEHLAPAAAYAASINVTAIIDPSHVTTGTAATATYSPPLASGYNTGPAHYLFVWGDSYTSTGFNISETKPSPSNPMGNPAYPGLTDQPGMQNWIDLVTVNAGVKALTYNFAEGGASINNSLTEHSNPNVPAFVNQSITFLENLAFTPHPSYAPWNATNSAFIIWFGRNDVYWKEINDQPISQLDNAQNSLLLIMTLLVNAGAKRFIILGIPPLWREPIWSFPTYTQYKPSTLMSDAEYWNTALQSKLKTFQMFQTAANLSIEFIDVMPTFTRVLDNPKKYGAPDANCSNKDYATEEVTREDCLWADEVHPGPVLNQQVAALVGGVLRKDGFFGGSKVNPTQAAVSAGVSVAAGSGGMTVGNGAVGVIGGVHAWRCLTFVAFVLGVVFVLCCG